MAEEESTVEATETEGTTESTTEVSTNMKVYLLESIAKDVRITLDQNMVSDQLLDLGDVDTLSINDIIKSKILEAIKRVHCEAPAYLLNGGNNFGDAIYWEDDDTCGHILLPDDFMRFIVFEMDDWERPVFNAKTIDNAEYNNQSSRFEGVRGTAQKPKCFITIRPEGRALEFYSCKSQDALVSRAMYLPYPVIDEDYESVYICKRCYDAVVYTVAALAAITMGDTEKANILNELAKSALV